LKHWPQLCEELAHAVKAHDAILDGEIVCLDRRGRRNFKNLLFRREWPYFYAFDLLAVDGEDLRDWPLIERKRRLLRLIPSGADPTAVCGSHQGTRDRLLRGRVRARSRGHRGQVSERSLPLKNPDYTQITGGMSCSSSDRAGALARQCCVFRK
jgi:ATP dependent DNA ligase-like protein